MGQASACTGHTVPFEAPAGLTATADSSEVGFGPPSLGGLGAAPELPPSDLPQRGLEETQCLQLGRGPRPPGTRAWGPFLPGAWQAASGSPRAAAGQRQSLPPLCPPSRTPDPGPGLSALLTGSQRLHGGDGGRLAPVPGASRSGPRRRRRVTLALRNIGAEAAPRRRGRWAGGGGGARPGEPGPGSLKAFPASATTKTIPAAAASWSGSGRRRAPAGRGGGGEAPSARTRGPGRRRGRARPRSAWGPASRPGAGGGVRLGRTRALRAEPRGRVERAPARPLARRPLLLSKPLVSSPCCPTGNCPPRRPETRLLGHLSPRHRWPLPSHPWIPQAQAPFIHSFTQHGTHRQSPSFPVQGKG